MTLKTTIASDVADVFLDTDEFAVSVTYTPTGGAGSAINAIVSNILEELVDFEDGAQKLFTGSAWIDTADVSSPARGDTITISSVAYRVENVATDMAMHRLDFKRVVESEAIGSGYRIRR